MTTLVSRVDELTEAASAAIPDHVARWVKVGHTTGEADWDQFESGARRCYDYAGLPWPDRVVRVSSPLVLAVVAPLASYLADMLHQGLIDSGEANQIAAAVQRNLEKTADPVMYAVVEHAAEVATSAASQIRRRVRPPIRFRRASRISWPRCPIGEVVRPTILTASQVQLVAIRGTTAMGQLRVVSAGADLASLKVVGSTVLDCLSGSIVEAVNAAVDPIDAAVYDAIRRLYSDLCAGPQPGTMAASEVDSDFDRVVTCTVNGWYPWQTHAGGSWQLGSHAHASFLRDICDLELPRDLWDRDRAMADAQSAAGWWWAHRDFVMVADRPRVLHFEPTALAGSWSDTHRLHCADGPAIAWADGWELHFWHGTRVPADLITPGWGVEQILAERNQELRRCAIERMGWERFAVEANLSPITEPVPDPGNPGHFLTLFELPEGVYGQPARLLICDNATPESDGHRRRFGLVVPRVIDNPLTAAAWTFGLRADEYAHLQHAY